MISSSSFQTRNAWMSGGLWYELLGTTCVVTGLRVQPYHPDFGNRILVIPRSSCDVELPPLLLSNSFLYEGATFPH